ncbi:MAG: TIGR03084 family protein [Propionibacteriaceae bacterium]|jgi:uncharacterized protein (TIGR03084 family)|nr:TIGR03084 family protein [Propionibacteriaceae bacterium]
MKAIVTDLIAEQASFDTFCARLTDAQWEAPASNTEWTIKEELLHIAAFDAAARAMLSGGWNVVNEFADKYFGHDEIYRVTAFQHLTGAEVLDGWRVLRTQMDAAFLEKNPKDRVPWAPGLPMAARSLASARLMELWAHSVDVYDAFGLETPVTDRIQAVLFLGWQARPNAYRINGLEMPDTPLYVEVTLPSGATWAKGDPGAENWIKGSARDWALCVVRRRRPEDLPALEVHGAEAERYAQVVQAFAGEASQAASGLQGEPLELPG